MNSESRIHVVLNIVRYVNVAIGILLVLIIPTLILSSNWIETIRLSITAATNFSIYVGITRKRGWVVPLIVWVSLAQVIMSIVGDRGDIAVIIGKALFGMIGLVQLFVCTRRSVRSYLNYSGTTLF